jgi:hypothetical protein
MALSHLLAAGTMVAALAGLQSRSAEVPEGARLYISAADKHGSRPISRRCRRHGSEADMLGTEHGRKRIESLPCS